MLYYPMPRARDLTLAQAMGILKDAAANGEIVIRSFPESGRGLVVGGNIAGVQYAYIGSGGAVVNRASIDNLDARFGVLLLYMSRYLHSQGVRTVYDLGITHGGSNPDDVHNRGRAIDLAGFQFTDGHRLSVLNDWGVKKTPYAANADATSYRLRPGDRGYDFFRNLYAFLAGEAQDRTERTNTDNGPPTQIGAHSYVVTPDHPTRVLRNAHLNHFHAQIGPTRDPSF